ncbi:MAG: pectate lyase [Akkermansiaceae bacterium]
MRIIISFLIIFSQTTLAVSWKKALEQKPEWYSSTEAQGLAKQVILHQKNNGGWPKNQDFFTNLDREDLKKLENQRDKLKDATIDNGATYTPLKFLSRVWRARATPNVEKSLHLGLTFLLKSQYPNGGWPQRPNNSGYSLHITYNDGAMIGVMTYLRDLIEENPAYLTKDEKSAIETALTNGLDCILKTQIWIEGKPAVWCAQHDAKTLLPAKARSYEHPSFSGGESAGIIRYLMEIKEPSSEVGNSIEYAVEWLRANQIKGIRIATKDGNRVIVKDKNAPPLWARFYHLKTGKPIFSGRDGIIKSSFNEIEAERRNGYAWYVSNPRSILEDYDRDR